MGYLFLALALFAGVSKGYCGKKTGGYTDGLRDAVFANLLRMVICVLIGFILVIAGDGALALVPDARTFAISAFSGLSTAVFVVSWLVCVKKSAYMMLDVFLMLGVLIPVFFGCVLFGEGISYMQLFGIGVLLFAVWVMCSYNNSIKERLNLRSLLLLLLCGAASGCADLSQKLFVNYVPDVPASVFNFYTYIFCALVLALTYAVCTRGAPAPMQRDKLRGMAVYIPIMALCLFLNSYFKTLAAVHLDAVLLYPLNQALALILSTVMAALFFRERFTVKSAIGITAAFVGIVIINTH